MNFFHGFHVTEEINTYLFIHSSLPKNDWFLFRSYPHVSYKKVAGMMYGTFCVYVTHIEISTWRPLVINEFITYLRCRLKI